MEVYIPKHIIIDAEKAEKMGLFEKKSENWDEIEKQFLKNIKELRLNHRSVLDVKNPKYNQL